MRCYFTLHIIWCRGHKFITGLNVRLKVISDIGYIVILVNWRNGGGGRECEERGVPLSSTTLVSLCSPIFCT